MSTNAPHDLPLATVSIDLDGGATHLRGYGLRPDGPDRLLETAMPRLFTLLSELGIRATLFVVTGDRPPIELLQEALRLGHEIAAHSHSHEMPFSRMTADALRDEVGRGRAALQEDLRTEVVGFRAPNWDVDRSVFTALSATGYRYDASLLPTPMQAAIRAVLALGARDLRPLRAMPLLPPSVSTTPHQRSTPSGAIWEFPIPVTTPLRVPVYHTLRYRLPAVVFDRAIDAYARRLRSFGYALHAIDAVSATDPGVPSPLRVHPGMDLSLEEKERILRNSLEPIAARFRTVTYADQLSTLERADPAADGSR